MLSSRVKQSDLHFKKTSCSDSEGLEDNEFRKIDKDLNKAVIAEIREERMDSQDI